MRLLSPYSLTPRRVFTRVLGSKRAAAAIFAAAALLAMFAVGVFVAVPAQASSTSELNQKLDSTRSQLQQIREKIKQAEATKKAALEDIDALDQDIDVLEGKLAEATEAHESAGEALDALRSRLDELTKELNRKRQELKRTEGDLQQQQQVFDHRIASIYKSGGRAAYLEALFEPGSIGDLLDRIALLSRIADQDNRVLGQIKDLKSKVEDHKTALETERVRVASLEQEQRSLTEHLEALADERQASLDQIENARASKQRIVEAAEKDQASWNKQEDALLAESDRISAMLRAAVEAPPSTGGGQLSWPVNGRVSSQFGYRIHPIFHVRKMHTGVDLSAGMGVPIHAAASGTVVSAGWRGGYGKCVVINHGGGLATLYAHQSQILVSVGQKVDRGEVIGKVGSTGYSTGPHLHFEVRVNGSPVNPLSYL